MAECAARFQEAADVEPCPRCGNHTEFRARSEQDAEDCCSVWIECRCGFDPTAENGIYRVEDVWGSINKGTVLLAKDVWNDMLRPTTEPVEEA